MRWSRTSLSLNPFTGSVTSTRNPRGVLYHDESGQPSQLCIGDLTISSDSIDWDQDYLDSLKNVTCGYLLKDGKCFVVGNDQHEHGWWILDDWIWNFLLWEIESDGTQKPQTPEGLIPVIGEDGTITEYVTEPSPEEIEKTLLQLGFTRDTDPRVKQLESLL